MGRLTDRIEKRMPKLHRFLTRHDKPWPLVREVLFGAFGLLIVVTLLFGLTGQPLVGGYPVVVVTSGSMMHCNNYGDSPIDPATGRPDANRDFHIGKGCKQTSYGRIGTIDPGDLVFVRKVSNTDSIHTFAAGGGDTYGRDGDVVVYRPNGSTQATPIIHRALFFLEVHDDGTFSVAELGLSHVDRLDQRAVTDLTGCTLTLSPGHGATASQFSGFVTRGDNNEIADQCSGILPVRMEWVLGKARGEVPWIGLVNLLVGDISNSSSNNFGNAGSDSKVMLGVVVVLVIATPYTIRFVQKRRRKEEE